MSFTGALLAVFIQQWAQPYLQATQGRHSPRERARIRIFHAEGLKKLHLRWVTRAVPLLIQVSLFLFFSGLPIFLFDVNRTVFNFVVTWLGLCLAGYACITLMPIFYQDSPYYSPLSPFVWWCVTNMLFIVHGLLEKLIPLDSSVFRWYDTHYARSHLRWPSSRAMQGATEQYALQLPSDIDYRALLWMFKTLNDDNDFEQFFDALPSLCDLEEFVDAHKDFIKPNEKILSHALIGMMNRTLLSDLVPEKVKQRRIIICSKALGATSLLGPWSTLHRVLCGDWHGFSRSIHFGLFVQNWKKVTHPVTTFYTQFVVAATLASAQEQERDDRWLQLASEQLKKSTSVIQFFLEYGGDDTILLPNAIFIIRRTIQTFSGSEDDHQKDILEASSKTLKLICRFDIQRTLEEHQHQFCDLWNQLVDAAQNDTHPRVTPLCTIMLKVIRKLYITLHEKTDSFPTAFSTTTDDRDRVLDDARSYPRCTIDEHSPFTPVPELQLDAELPRNRTHATASSMDIMIPPLSPSLVPRTPPADATSLPSVVSAHYNSVHSRPSHTSSVHHSVVSRRQSYISSMYDPVTPDLYTYVPGLYSSTAHSYPLIPRPSSPPGPVPGPYFPGPYPPVPRSYSPGPYPPVPRSYSPPGIYSPVPRLSSPPGIYSPVPRRSYSSPGPYSHDPRSYSHPAPTPPGVSPFVYLPQVASSRARHSRHLPATTTEADSRHDVPAFITPFSLASEDMHMRVDASVASTSRSSLPTSPVDLVRLPEPALLAQQEPPVSPPGADFPISTPPLDTPTPHINASRGAPGFADSSDSLGRLFGPPAMDMPETPPTPPLPTPASVSGSTMAAPVPPAILSTPQELVLNPETLFSVPPVTPMGIPTQAAPDSGSTHHTVVRFAISKTPSLVSLYTMPVLTSPSASPRPVSFSVPMRGAGGPVQTPLAMPSVIKFDRYGEFSGLLYYSPHSVLYEGELYPTALHLFEARKFLPYRPDLAARVRGCEHVEQVTSISAELADFARRDWNDIMLSAVSKFVLSRTTFVLD